MLKHHRLLAAAAAAVAVAASATVAVSGLTAASASPAVSHASPAVSGTEHIQIMTTSATSSNASVIVYGAFTAGGVDHQGASVDLFKFHNGNFKVRHSQGTGSQHFNPATCLAKISLHGTYKVFGGTGKYTGISGHGTYQLRILFIGGRNSKGKCSQKAAPVAFQQVIQASGPVHL